MNQVRSGRRPAPRWPWAIILLWGFVPLLWFRGTLLMSEDLRLPAGPAEWARTLSVWNPMIGAGVPAPLDASLLFFQTIPAMCRALGGSLIGTQQISFVWWFLLAGVGIYTLASRLIPGTPWAWLVATSFYLFNPWLDHVWLGCKPPLVAGYAVVPLILVFLWDAMRHRRSLIATLAWLGILSWIGASIGNNVSETLAVVCPLVLFAVVVLIRDAARRDTRQLVWDGRVFITAAVVMGLASAFWVLPQAAAILEQVHQEGMRAYESTSRTWLTGVSTHTSILNVLRFQGDWTWYDGFGGEPYKTYALLYAKHPLYLILSWVVPAAAIWGVLYGRSPFRLFLTLLIGLGVFLSMGTHPPMGVVYGWCVDHIPLWWIVRSPYFKFMFLTCLGYALALGLAYARLATWVRRSWQAIAIAVVMIGIHLVYAGPFVLGRMYARPTERTRLPPNHVTIPSHVMAAASWFNQQQDFFRIYHLPAKAAWTTTWGYAASSPILTFFSRHPEVFEYEPAHILYTQGAMNTTMPVQRLAARALYAGATSQAADLLRLLGIRYILHETDLVYDFYQGPGHVTYDNPAFVRAALARQDKIAKGPTFGPWEIYRVENPLPHAFQIPKATLVLGDVRTLDPLAGTTAFAAPVFVLSAETPTATIQQLLRIGAFDRVVVAPDTRVSVPLPPSLPIMLVASLEQLTRRVDPWRTTPLAPRQGFGPPTGGALRHLWCPLRSNGASNWVLHNSDTTPLPWHLAGTVISPKAPRSLFTYLDQQLLDVHVVPADIPTPISVSFTLPPGDHSIIYYSPNARTPGPDGQDVGFYFAEDWQAGPPAWMGTFEVTRAGPYRIQVVAGHTASAAPHPMIRVGGDAIALSQDPMHANQLLGTAGLSVGQIPVSVSDIGAATYLFRLTPLDQPTVLPQRITPLSVGTVSPTRYVSPRLAEPGWLLFNEGYHAGWVAESRAVGSVHVRANGFANGYYFVTAPEGPVTLAFTMQRWSCAGIMISLGTVGGILVWWVVGRRRKKSLANDAQRLLL